MVTAYCALALVQSFGIRINPLMVALAGLLNQVGLALMTHAPTILRAISFVQGHQP